MFFHFVQKSGLERLAKKGIVEMFYNTPKAIIRETTFRNEAMNVGIPFKGTTESMKNTDKAGYKVLGFVYLIKHTKYNAADSIEQTVKKGTVFEKKVTEFFVNGKNTVAVGTLN